MSMMTKTAAEEECYMERELPPFESPSISEILDHFLKYKYARKVSKELFSNYRKIAEKVKENLEINGNGKP